VTLVTMRALREVGLIELLEDLVADDGLIGAVERRGPRGRYRGSQRSWGDAPPPRSEGRTFAREVRHVLTDLGGLDDRDLARLELLDLDTDLVGREIEGRPARRP